MTASALAAMAVALGLLSDTGPLVPGLAVAVAVAGAVRARVAQVVTVCAVAPLLFVIGLEEATLAAAAVCLAAAATLWWLQAATRPGAGDATLAARVVLAAGEVLVALLLAWYALLFLTPP